MFNSQNLIKIANHNHFKTSRVQESPIKSKFSLNSRKWRRPPSHLLFFAFSIRTLYSSSPTLMLAVKFRSITSLIFRF